MSFNRSGLDDASRPKRIGCVPPAILRKRVRSWFSACFKERRLWRIDRVRRRPADHDALESISGSALLFPSLCQAAVAIPAAEADPPLDYCADRTAMMPKRRRTRAQNRIDRVATERRQNRDARAARAAPPVTQGWPITHGFDEDPPPF